MGKQWLFFLISSLIAFAGGYLLGKKWHIPAGRLTGAMAFTLIFEVCTGVVWYPSLLPFLVKVGTGAFIGVRFKKQDLFQLKNLFLPFAAMMLVMLGFTILSGFAIQHVTSIDLMTALLAITPGGVTEMGMLSLELGGDSIVVSTLQVLRCAIVIGVFPQIARLAGRFYHKRHPEAAPPASAAEAAPSFAQPAANWQNLLITLAVALLGGYLGQLSGIAGGVIIGSVLFTAILNIATQHAYVPSNKRWIVQTFAGLTIGARFTYDNLAQLGPILPAVLIMVLTYAIMWGLLIVILARISHMSIETIMFSTCPAGASDMALIALDMGGNPGQIATMHILRLILVITLFPTVYQLILSLF